MAKTKQRPDGWWYPYIFVGGMLLVIVVNAGLIFTALDSFSGPETEDHYRKGVAYNDNIAAARAQQGRGWMLTHVLDKGGLAVTFKDAEGHPVTGLEVKAQLVRPTHQGHDLEVPLTAEGGGTYRAPGLKPPLPGQWDLRVRAWRGSEHFQETRRVVVP